MRLGISAKLFLGILIACALVLIANGVAGRIIFERGFMGYLNEQGEERMREILPRLQQAYVQHGNWDFVRGNPEAWFSLMRPASMQAGMPLQAPPVSDQIGAVLDHVQAGMRGRFADADLTLDAEVTPAALLIQGDERRLQQLFSNLLENALRYTDGGGRVHTSVRQRDDQVEVVIEDSAPGVDEAHRERLFERFYRVENSRNRATGGSGLGLAISQNIVRTHGGSIRAEASALGGLRIVMRFPVVAA